MFKSHSRQIVYQIKLCFLIFASSVYGCIRFITSEYNDEERVQKERFEFSGRILNDDGTIKMMQPTKGRISETLAYRDREYRLLGDNRDLDGWKQ